MQNIIDILKGIGIEVPAEKQEELTKQVAANYKTISEHNQKIGKLESERDGFKEQLTAAQETLKGFEGVDVKDWQKKLDEWKQKAETAEKTAAEKLAQRDFDDALKAKLEEIKFSSAAAKRAVTDQIRALGLKLTDGAILGFDDAINAIKAKDADAFVDEGNPPAKFTTSMGKQTGGKQYKTAEEIFQIKDASERQAAIAANPQLFVKGE